MKTYTIREMYKGRMYEHTGTLAELVQVYKYRLECNGIEDYQVKSIKSLMKHLQNGQDYWSNLTSYELV